jgi:hypothetical protein
MKLIYQNTEITDSIELISCVLSGKIYFLEFIDTDNNLIVLDLNNLSLKLSILEKAILITIL